MSTKFVPTDRNKSLSPIPTAIGVIGYNSEIHYDDSIEHDYILPLGAIKRLIQSYYEEIYSIDSEWVYISQTGSYEMRMQPYCYRMIDEIKNQLDKHGLDGKNIVDEVFNRYFKKKYEELKKYDENHHGQGCDGFKPCKDTSCCNFTDNIDDKLHILLPVIKSIFLAFSTPINKAETAYLSWHKVTKNK